MNACVQELFKTSTYNWTLTYKCVMPYVFLLCCMARRPGPPINATSSSYFLPPENFRPHMESKILHTQILDGTNSSSTAGHLARRQLRWVGHVIQMPEHRHLRQVLYGQLKKGRRKPGGPKKRLKNQIKSTFRTGHIPQSSLETFASELPV